MSILCVRLSANYFYVVFFFCKHVYVLFFKQLLSLSWKLILPLFAVFLKCFNKTTPLSFAISDSRLIWSPKTILGYCSQVKNNDVILSICVFVIPPDSWCCIYIVVFATLHLQYWFLMFAVLCCNLMLWQDFTPIAWVNIPIYNYESRFMEGEHTLPMWPFESVASEDVLYPIGQFLLTNFHVRILFFISYCFVGLTQNDTIRTKRFWLLFTIWRVLSHYDTTNIEIYAVSQAVLQHLLLDRCKHFY